jgi:hypothetical protein
MEKAAVDGWARVLPVVLLSPVGPEGMVTVSADAGTNGLVGWKTSEVGVMRCHVPATGGAKVGIGVSAASGTETLTVMVLSEATLVAAVVGVVLMTVSGVLVSTAAWAVGAGVAVGEAAAVLAVNRIITVDSPAIKSTAAATKAITSGDRRLGGRRCPWARWDCGFDAGIVLSVRRHASS